MLLKWNFQPWISKSGDNWGQNFKTMVPIGNMFIWKQIPKSGDCPLKMGTFGHLTVKGKLDCIGHWQLRNCLCRWSDFTEASGGLSGA